MKKIKIEAVDRIVGKGKVFIEATYWQKIKLLFNGGNLDDEANIRLTKFKGQLHKTKWKDW